ncbi:hypothetical protein M1M92_04255 [Peptococcaceae bacterium]|nr:hypothetical protein [Peptococcaceae bacterium]
MKWEIMSFTIIRATGFVRDFYETHKDRHRERDRQNIHNRHITGDDGRLNERIQHSPKPQ